MAARKTFLLLFISLTLCGSIIAVEDDKAEEERGLLGNSGFLKQQDNSTNEATSPSSGLFGRRPCNCKDNYCRCCIRTFFPAPPLLRQRACMNLSYADDDSGMNMIITYNRRTLYNNTIQDQSRQPIRICASPPLFSRIQICGQLSEVYTKRQNMHTCLNIEGIFSNRTLFTRTMGCMFVGPNGFPIARPDTDGSDPGVENPETSEEEQDSVEDAAEESNEANSVVAEIETTPSPTPSPTEGTRSVEREKEEDGGREEAKKKNVKDKNEITEV